MTDDNRKKQITSPEAVAELLKGYAGRRQEHFLVITLTSANTVIRKHMVTKGILDASLAHPREVFWVAIKDNAKSIIVAHNHPSGNLKPSDQDIFITEKLSKAGEIMGIKLLDHVIISREGFLSLKSEGYL